MHNFDSQAMALHYWVDIFSLFLLQDIKLVNEKPTNIHQGRIQDLEQGGAIVTQSCSATPTF